MYRAGFVLQWYSIPHLKNEATLYNSLVRCVAKPNFCNCHVTELRNTFYYPCSRTATGTTVVGITYMYDALPTLTLAVTML